MEERHQENIHRALDETLPELEDDEVLTGWLVVYESQTADGTAVAGHVYGPTGMTTWRALGLAQWAALYTLHPDQQE